MCGFLVIVLVDVFCHGFLEEVFQRNFHDIFVVLLDFLKPLLWFEACSGTLAFLIFITNLFFKFQFGVRNNVLQTEISNTSIQNRFLGRVENESIYFQFFYVPIGTSRLFFGTDSRLTV